MTATTEQSAGLRTELTRSLSALWTRYAGERPSNAHIEFRDNVVTCVLADAVDHFDRNMTALEAADPVAGEPRLTPARYKREAVSAVARLTGQRVQSFVSRHDRETGTATEVFILERVRPRA